MNRFAISVLTTEGLDLQCSRFIKRYQ